MENDKLLKTLERIADTLERISPPKPTPTNLEVGDAFVWNADNETLELIINVSKIQIQLLKGIELQQKELLKNTRQFASGFPANNILLWGARGTGKSSLVKAAHSQVNDESDFKLVLIEIHREDIQTLPKLLRVISLSRRRIIIFCDDLSFDGGDNSYKSLKTILDGGLQGKPENILFYATSNRRHLMARDMIENESSTAINPNESIEEKVSLSDRFGLWLGFHNIDQDTYFNIVGTYAEYYKLDIAQETLKTEANEWAVTRGARSGRVAWQFIQNLAGRLGKTLS